MKHTLYARFPASATAVAAVRELHGLGAETLIHDRELESGKLEMPETDALPRLVKGALLGGVLGPLSAVIIFLIADVPIVAPAVLLAAILGAACCALGGMIIGSAAPDPTLQALADSADPGDLLVTVVLPHLQAEARALAIIHAHDGTTARRGMVATGTLDRGDVAHTASSPH